MSEWSGLNMRGVVWLWAMCVVTGMMPCCDEGLAAVPSAKASARAGHSAGESASRTVRSFLVKGVVREVASNGKSLTVRHEEIPGYMPKMTMELTVKNPSESKAVRVGDQIEFRMMASEEEHWIDTIRVLVRGVDQGSGKVDNATKAGNVREVKVGDLFPDAELLSESGQRVRLEGFRGRALAFTFLFTRCPLPEFCPRMSKHFSRARNILLNGDGKPSNWQFLCLSFDSQNDTPEVLRRYARNYRGESDDRWLFASVDPATLKTLAALTDLKVANEGGSFSHNLRTVVLDTRGRVHRLFDGNEWTPEQLAESVESAARVPELSGGR